MHDKDKLAYYHLLTGNNGEDLLDLLWPHLSTKFKKELDNEVQEYFKEVQKHENISIEDQVQETVGYYDEFTKNGNTIWR